MTNGTLIPCLVITKFNITTQTKLNYLLPFGMHIEDYSGIILDLGYSINTKRTFKINVDASAT